MYMLWSKWVKLKLENLNLNYQYVHVSLYIGTHATVNQLYSPARKFQETFHLHLLHANNSWYNSGSHTMIKKILPHINSLLFLSITQTAKLTLPSLYIS